MLWEVLQREREYKLYIEQSGIEIGIGLGIYTTFLERKQSSLMQGRIFEVFICLIALTANISELILALVVHIEQESKFLWYFY